MPLSRTCVTRSWLVCVCVYTGYIRSPRDIRAGNLEGTAARVCPGRTYVLYHWRVAAAAAAAAVSSKIDRRIHKRESRSRAADSILHLSRIYAYVYTHLAPSLLLARLLLAAAAASGASSWGERALTRLRLSSRPSSDFHNRAPACASQPHHGPLCLHARSVFPHCVCARVSTLFIGTLHRTAAHTHVYARLCSGWRERERERGRASGSSAAARG